MAFQVQEVEGPPGLGDNDVLDEWRIPFGDWYDQAVDWVNNELGPILDFVDWLFGLLVDFVNETILLGPPWFVIIIAFFFIGWLAQNIKVGIFSSVALMICALMGNGYWEQTAKTIGFIAVAVLLCTVIGIPIGILAGRVDSFWTSVRPVLDAMQVVHSFVYMLPFIFFFGIGEVSATIVTMVFALPPLIRLTNLGIRSVPEDVVEASRAFGQTELAILRDVQLPLARPAIMTGINQTLLLSISMLGIAAIMGAGGLAQFMFRALSNQDPALSGSAGLSFFLVAVVLDRITQRDGDNSKSLAARMQRAWSNRTTPEALLATPEALTDQLPETASSRVVYEPVTGSERTGIAVSIVGSVVVLVSLMMTWNTDGGWFSSFSRRFDELGTRDASATQTAGDLAGQSFNGIDASGGSWFGYVLILLAFMTIAAGIAVMTKPGETSRWLNSDGSVIASLGALVVTLAYVLSKPSAISVAESGSGPVIALVGAAVMAVGSLLWIRSAKHEPLRPLANYGSIAPAVTALIGVALLLGAGFANFTLDERSDVVITPEIQAEIDRLTDRARDPDTPQAEKVAISTQIPSILAEAKNSETITLSGFAGDGSTMGRWTLIAGFLGLASTTLSAGMGITRRSKRWMMAGIAAAAGVVGFLVFSAVDPFMPNMTLVGIVIALAMAAIGAFMATKRMIWGAIFMLIPVIIGVLLMWVDPFTFNPMIAAWILAIVAGLAVMLLVMTPQTGLRDTRMRWIFGAISLGLGAGIAAVALGWIGTLARATDPGVVSGVGSFFTLLAGVAIANSGRSVINDFRRSRVYGAIADQEIVDLAGTNGTDSGTTVERAAVGAASN